MSKKEFILTEIGFIAKELYLQKNYRNPDREEISICENWINQFCRYIKRFNPEAYSYSLKHKVEDWGNQYISNGAFISAAMNLGYKYRISGDRGPNTIFNMDFRLPENNWQFVRPINLTRWLFKRKEQKDPIGDLARDAFNDPTWPRRASKYIEFKFYLEKSGACDGCLQALSDAWLNCFNAPPQFPNKEIETICDNFYDGICSKILNYGDHYLKAPIGKTYIYVLYEPETDLESLKVRYVGQSKNPSNRLKQHIVSPGSIKKVIWVGNLLAKGIYPLMGIIDLVDNRKASFMEEMYVLAFYDRERKLDQSNKDNLLNSLLIEKYLPVFEHVIN